MAKFCKNCGSELKEGADVCVKCGKTVEETPVAQNSGSATGKTPGISIAALILGIASVVLFWVPVVSFIALGAGIAALILGVKGRKKPGKTGMATAGMVLGIIGLALSAIWSVCYVCACSTLTTGVNEGILDAIEDYDYSDWDY